MAEFALRCSCPECGNRLGIKDERLLGKTITCPKCKVLFLVEAEAPPNEGPPRKPPAKAAPKSTAPKRPPADEDYEDEVIDDDLDNEIKSKDKRSPNKRRPEPDDDLDEEPDDEDERPRAKPKKRKRKSSRKRRIVGLLPLMLFTPPGIYLLIMAPSEHWASLSAVGLGLFLLFGGYVVVYRLFQKGGLQGELDEAAQGYEGGAALMGAQIAYAFQYPRLLAAWVFLQLFGLGLLITGGLIAEARIRRGDLLPKGKQGNAAARQAPEFPRETPLSC